MSHPKAVSSLEPLNQSAEEVVKYPDNQHLKSVDSSGRQRLDVGQSPSVSGLKNTFAVLGRGCQVDIFIPQSTVSKWQCSFERVKESGAIMLYDNSTSHSTQVYGGEERPF